MISAGSDCNVDISELLKERLSSVFEFMNEDRGGQFFCLDDSTAFITSLLQCFAVQNYMHAAVSDKFKRRVTWHRSIPFNFADSEDTNSFLVISGMLFAQKLNAAPEIKQCIDYCRKRSWCPSSSQCRLQQQRESCFLSALLLHTVCIAHPLFTFCAVVADAVPRLLSWLHCTILLTAASTNPKQMVVFQPQSLATWIFAAFPLEVYTLVFTNYVHSFYVC